jgi:hypothetical protein
VDRQDVRVQVTKRSLRLLLSISRRINFDEDLDRRRPAVA